MSTQIIVRHQIKPQTLNPEQYSTFSILNYSEPIMLNEVKSRFTGKLGMLSVAKSRCIGKLFNVELSEIPIYRETSNVERSEIPVYRETNKC